MPRPVLCCAGALRRWCAALGVVGFDLQAKGCARGKQTGTVRWLFTELTVVIRLQYSDIKSLRCTPKMNTMLCVNYMSIKKQTNEM